MNLLINMWHKQNQDLFSLVYFGEYTVISLILHIMLQKHCEESTRYCSNYRKTGKILQQHMAKWYDTYWFRGSQVLLELPQRWHRVSRTAHSPAPLACTTLSGILSLSKWAISSVKITSWTSRGPLGPAVCRFNLSPMGWPPPVVKVSGL